MSITRDKVARKAGVSSATVSRVFNNPESVSKELREKVILVSRNLNYKPNKVASQLRRKGFGVIAVVKVNKENRNYYWGSLELFDWFYAKAQKGLLNAIENTSYQLSFHTINNSEDLKEIEGKVDGIIGYDVDTEIEEKMFKKVKIPCVLSHHIRPNNNLIHVSTDNEYGGTLQGKYLLENKIKNPLYISGYINQVLAHKQRLKGVRSIYPNIEIININFLDINEFNLMINNLEKDLQEKKYDGIIFVNDLVLVKTIAKININIPVIGYDGAPYVSLIETVASIDLNISKIYETALLKVISIINGQGVEGEVVYPSIIE